MHLARHILAGKTERRIHHAPPVFARSVAQQDAQRTIFARRHDLTAVDPLREVKRAELYAHLQRIIFFLKRFFRRLPRQIQMPLHDARRVRCALCLLQKRRKCFQNRIPHPELDRLLTLRVVVSQYVYAHQIAAARRALQIGRLSRAPAVKPCAQQRKNQQKRKPMLHVVFLPYDR